MNMGEWSEYFEDFPEEDMGNYRNGVFDPELARRRHPNNFISNYVSPRGSIAERATRNTDALKRH